MFSIKRYDEGYKPILKEFSNYPMGKIPFQRQNYIFSGFSVIRGAILLFV